MSKELSSLEWFKIWLKIGLQSFGGGVSTLALIRQELIERRQLVTEEEFLKTFALSQLSPGINLIGISILLGRRQAGPKGAVLAASGMLLPSAAVTAALTAIYAQFKSVHVVVSALHLVIPAVAGLGLATALQTASPTFATERREGWLGFIVAGILWVGSALAVSLFKIATPAVLLSTAAIGAMLGSSAMKD